MELENTPQLLDEKEVAEYLSVSVKTLRRWRFDRRGPSYAKVGGKLIRYPYRELKAWVDQQIIHHDSKETL